MKVKKLTEDELNSCGKIISEFIKSWKVNLVIFIGDGGTNLMKYIPGDYYYTEVKVKHKKSKIYSKISKIIPRLPEWVKYLLRLANHYLGRKPIERDVDLSQLAKYGFDKQYVIIDDCIDTGVTLDHVISELSPGYRVVSINDIHGDRSDLFFYSNVICKFPWNLDY